MRYFMALLLGIFATTNANAFDANLTYKEELELAGKPLVEQLSVGVKGLVDEWAFCRQDGEVFIEGWEGLVTDYDKKWDSVFQITLQADGTFVVEFKPAAEEKWRSGRLYSADCPDKDEFKKQPLFKIKSINGFTDLASYYKDIIAKGMY